MPNYGSDYENKRFGIINDLIPEGHFRSLDIACNKGLFSKMLLDKGHRVTGIDGDAGLIAQARQMYPDRERVNFIQCDVMESATVFTEQFDFILALEIIEHCVDYPRFLENTIALLKPKATLLISTPNLFSPEGMAGKTRELITGNKFMAWDEGHKHLFTSFSFINLLKRHQLTIKKVVGFHFGMTVPLSDFKITVPFCVSQRPPLNRLGFNTIVLAEK